MPGFATHYLFGVDAYKSLQDTNLRKIIQKYSHSYALGLQGPDVFFFYVPITVGMKINIGGILHKENTNAFFEEMIKYMSDITIQKDFEILSAYIQGFMGHYLLDTSIHPYVYSRVGSSKSRKTLGKHFSLETDIDREVLWHFKKTHQADFSHSDSIAINSREKKTIATMLHHAIMRAYDIDIPVKLIKSAISAFQTECSLLSDSSEWKYKILNGIETRIFGYNIMSPLFINDIHHTEDPCNLNHRTWSNPWDSTHSSDASVFDIFKGAREKYVSYMALMQDALTASHILSGDKSTDILTKLENKSYTSGLDCSIILKR